MDFLSIKFGPISECGGPQINGLLFRKWRMGSGMEEFFFLFVDDFDHFFHGSTIGFGGFLFGRRLYGIIQ